MKNKEKFFMDFNEKARKVLDKKILQARKEYNKEMAKLRKYLKKGDDGFLKHISSDIPEVEFHSSRNFSH